jgi:predicted enzyme related to lactoylglutathione lyase
MGLDCTHAWVTIAVADFDRSCQFYQRWLDQTPQAIIPGHYAEFHIADLRLGIYRSRPHERPTTPEPSPFPPVSLCFAVENLATAIAHLTQLGYPPPDTIITAPHGQELYAYDPDGNRLILYQPIAEN